MIIPVVVIKVPLYQVDDEDQRVPFTQEELQEILRELEKAEDVKGYTIGSIELVEEEWDDKDAEELAYR